MVQYTVTSFLYQGDAPVGAPLDLTIPDDDPRFDWQDEDRGAWGRDFASAPQYAMAGP